MIIDNHRWFILSWYQTTGRSKREMAGLVSTNTPLQEQSDGVNDLANGAEAPIDPCQSRASWHISDLVPECLGP